MFNNKLMSIQFLHIFVRQLLIVFIFFVCLMVLNATFNNISGKYVNTPDYPITLRLSRSNQIQNVSRVYLCDLTRLLVVTSRVGA
jgi:flagellar biosynthesis protein FlhB